MTEPQLQDKTCAECGRELLYVGHFGDVPMYSDDSVPRDFELGAMTDGNNCFSCDARKLV